MRNLLSRFLRLPAAAVLFAAIAGASMAQGGSKPLDKETKDAVLAKMGQLVLGSCYVPGVDFSKWPEFLEKEKEKIDKAQTDTDFSEAINSQLSKFFGISHIVLVTPRNATARIERKVVGIGVQIQLEPEGLRVVSVFPNAPASEAGLEVGDLIMEADGKKLTSTTQMLGEEGTPVEIKVKHANGKTKTYKLVRKKYSNVREDTITWPNANTAVITVHTFDMAYDRNRIDDLFDKAKPAANLVVDLRSNGGGIVLNMLHFLGHLIPPDKGFGTFVNRSMVRDYAAAMKQPSTDLRAIASWADRPLKPRAGSEIFKGNIVVLVNGGTGSAAEISAQALKECRDAQIVGTKSAGAVLVSVMSQLPGGWVLQFPMMDYVSALGVRLEGNGVEPDVLAQMPKPNEPDAAIDKAQALFRRIELRNERGGKGDGRVPALR